MQMIHPSITNVSIHALLAECDVGPRIPRNPLNRFNPRTPCGVRRRRFCASFNMRRFQSTHSLRSATPNLYTFLTLFPVSIHALLAECDVKDATSMLPDITFQSTHSLRSATTDLRSCSSESAVSIHALLAECDIALLQGFTKFAGFNPRTPCGVRPLSSPERLCL